MAELVLIIFHHLESCSVSSYRHLHIIIEAVGLATPTLAGGFIGSKPTAGVRPTCLHTGVEVCLFILELDCI